LITWVLSEGLKELLQHVLIAFAETLALMVAVRSGEARGRKQG